MGGLIRLLAFYRAVNSRIVAGALFSVNSVIDSVLVNKVWHF